MHPTIRIALVTPPKWIPNAIPDRYPYMLHDQVEETKGRQMASGPLEVGGIRECPGVSEGIVTGPSV